MTTLEDSTLNLDSFLAEPCYTELGQPFDLFDDQSFPIDSVPTLPPPIAPQTPSPTTTKTDDPAGNKDTTTFAALSDSELSSLLHDPQPYLSFGEVGDDPSSTPENSEPEDALKVQDVKLKDGIPTSPATSSAGSVEAIVPSKRRRINSPTSSFSSVASKNIESNPASSAGVDSYAGSSGHWGCSDCEDAHAAATAGGKSVLTRKQLEQRLKLSTEENGRLRKRVADLVQENRGLRGNVEELGRATAAMSNALQAAAAQNNSRMADQDGGKENGGAMVGLATVPKEMAKKLGGMVVIGGKERKRRRKKVGTAMACVMFMMAAIVGLPDYFSDNGDMLALPGMTGPAAENEHGLVPVIRQDVPGPSTELCEYIARRQERKAIADHSGNIVVKTEEHQAEPSSLFVKMEDSSDNNIIRPDSDVGDEKVDEDDGTDKQLSYVLCKDSEKAVNSVESCIEARKRGEKCPAAKTISLIMPMRSTAFGLDTVSGEDNNTRLDGKTTLAEVQCTIKSVRQLISRTKTARAVTNGQVIGVAKE